MRGRSTSSERPPQWGQTILANRTFVRSVGGSLDWIWDSRRARRGRAPVRSSRAEHGSARPCTRDCGGPIEVCVWVIAKAGFAGYTRTPSSRTSHPARLSGPWRESAGQSLACSIRSPQRFGVVSLSHFVCPRPTSRESCLTPWPVFHRKQLTSVPRGRVRHHALNNDLIKTDYATGVDNATEARLCGRAGPRRSSTLACLAVAPFQSARLR